MSQPMLEIENLTKSGEVKSTAHLLPCRVHHDGSIGPIDSFWTPTDTEEGKKEAYFRGRKLHAKAVPLPSQFIGIVAERQAAVPQPTDPYAPIDLEKEDDDDAPPVDKMKALAEFDEIMVWGHENVTNAADDTYVRSLEEWVEASERIHSYEKDTPAEAK
ncbi:unnamed protein product [Clonostachys chloroleuca]|uniref:Uncharacterized protein n=1 Tax=Clonostachys chloroleuca TaxID=1926264 RepID=A0AA35Q2F1_9HYPO|nr:unnamed protein product [Clonostachys chloroleuca]